MTVHEDKEGYKKDGIVLFASICEEPCEVSSSFLRRVLCTVIAIGAAAALLVLVPGQTASAEGFIEAEGTQLTLDGKPYRAIGVNIPHLSQAYMGTWLHCKPIYATREAMQQAIRDALLDADQHHVAFVRFFASPGYPKGTAELYTKDKAEYWRQMDELFGLCRKHRLKVVPCLQTLFKWNLDFGEPRTAVLDPNSKTHVAAYGYVREFVSRYKNDPIVLMWELENEAFLAADVNQQGKPEHGKGVYPKGTTFFREKRSIEDSFRYDDLAEFYREMAAFIHSLDPNHLVTSGDAGVRQESMCRRKTFPNFQWRDDTVREHLSNLLTSQPEPLDVFSLHHYGNFTSQTKVGNLSHLNYLTTQVRALHASGTPLFVGELGQQAPHFQADREAKWTCAAIDALDQEGVALIALWTWHFPWQDKDHNIPNGAAQPLLMEHVGKFNRQHAQRSRSVVPEDAP